MRIQTLKRGMPSATKRHQVEELLVIHMSTWYTHTHASTYVRTHARTKYPLPVARSAFLQMNNGFIRGVARVASREGRIIMGKLYLLHSKVAGDRVLIREGPLDGPLDGPLEAP